MKIKFSIGKKIGTGFGVLIFLTLLAFILTQFTLNDSRRKTDEVTDIYTPSVSKLEELNLLIVRSKMLITNWVFIQSTDDTPDKKRLRTLVNEEYPDLKMQIQQYEAKWNNVEEKNDIESIFSLIDKLFSTDKDIMKQLNSFSSYEDPSILFLIRPQVENGEVDQQTKLILDNLSKLITEQRSNATMVTNQMLDSFSFLQFVVRGLGIALLLGGILIAFFTIRTIVRPVTQLKKMLLSMGIGVLPKERIKDRNDEIGEMSTALNGLIEGLKSTTEFANEVGTGNFESYYKPLSEEDTLGQALLKMRVELRENERVLEAKVVERTEEVVRQKEEIELQSQKLEILYKHVTDSIRYAKRIQESILPPDKIMAEMLPNSFVLYKPKDIVSGDFYWMQQKGDWVLFSAVDCTGHGVPGAFMSIVAYNILKHAVNSTDEVEPGKILDKLSEGVRETLHQGIEGDSAKDGMDLALCAINYKKMELQYAGAYNPLYIIRNNELIQTKADKFPIGYYASDVEKHYTNHTIKLEKGDCIYIFSDGYADQFGGVNGKKFMVNNFRQLIFNIHQHPIQEQKHLLNKTIEEWRGNHEQVDDIMVIGIKV
ncbi:MAG: SpoIIE family protein phosphatase [Bacteroidia bacterium]